MTEDSSDEFDGIDDERIAERLTDEALAAGEDARLAGVDPAIRRTIETILARHDLAVDDFEVTVQMSEALSIAEQMPTGESIGAFVRRREHEKKTERLERLEQLNRVRELIDLCAEDWSLARAYRNATGNDLGQLRVALDDLVSVEDSLIERIRSEPTPPNRPESPKNAAARMLFEWLIEHGADPWKAVGAIADLFVEVGISTPGWKRERKALWEKLRRLVR